MQYNAAKLEYIVWLRKLRKASETTVVNYQAWLNRYGRWLEDEGWKNTNVDVALHCKTMTQWFEELGSTGIKGRTIRQAHHALRSLCQYLIDKGVIEVNTAKQLTLPRREAGERKTPSDTEVADLLAACERQINEHDIAFDCALVSTLVFTGLRCQECLELKVSDINLHNDTLTVRHGKGDKTRIQCPPSEFWIAINAWLKEREKMACTHDWLWAQDRNRRISVEWMRRRVNEIAARAGHKNSLALKPHALRHWYAHNLLKNGTDVVNIQAALGHSDLQTTWTYLKTATPSTEVTRTKAKFDWRDHKAEIAAKIREELGDKAPPLPAPKTVPAPVPAAPPSHAEPQMPASMGQMDMMQMMMQFMQFMQTQQRPR